MSPLSMPKIQEQHEEEASSSYSPLRPSMSLTPKKQQAIVDEPEPQFVKSHSLDDKPTSPASPRENDDTVLHGSSEFMLVLFPEDQEKKPEDTVERRKSLGETLFRSYDDLDNVVEISCRCMKSRKCLNVVLTLM